MRLKDHAAVVAYYEQRLAEHGSGPLAVDWNSEEAQELLFFALIDGLDEGALGSGASVLDVGCGLGALYQFLRERGLRVDYTGYDLSPGMVAAAAARHPQARFEVRDLLVDPPPDGSFDFVFLSGSISLRLPRHGRYVRAMIQRMFRLARRSVAFNLLSTWALPAGRAYQTDELRYYADPAAILRYCSGLTTLASLRHDVAGWTFTVQLHRRGATHPRPARRFERHLARRGSQRAAASKLIAHQLELGDQRACLELLAEPGADADRWNLRAVCCSRAGDQVGEQQALERALSLDPRHTWARLNLGALHYRLGDHARAVQCFQAALDSDPANDVAREQLFYSWLRRGEDEAARALLSGFAHAAQRDLLEGELHYARSRWAQAAAAYRRSLRAAPYLIDARRRLIAVARARGDGRAEEAELRRLLRLVPHDLDARRALAERALAAERPARALRLLAEAAPDPGLDALRERARALLAARRQARVGSLSRVDIPREDGERSAAWLAGSTR